jgi:hypothetical protein
MRSEIEYPTVQKNFTDTILPIVGLQAYVQIVSKSTRLQQHQHHHHLKNMSIASSLNQNFLFHCPTVLKKLAFWN